MKKIIAILALPALIFAQTPIYRSVQPGNTSAIWTSGGVTMTISGSTATFSSNAPDTIGVGCAIQYDSTGLNLVINAIAFIHGRTNATTFIVKRFNGGTPPSVTGCNNWSIFHAYTNLSNWYNSSENTGINASVRNFDAFGSRNIETANEFWYVACYNGLDSLTSGLSMGAWNTSPTNRIKFYTPYLSSQVGTSQRHRGWYGYGFRVAGSFNNALISWAIATTMEHHDFEGLQFKQTGSSAGNCIYFSNFDEAGAVNRVSHCIFRGPANASGSCNIQGIYSFGAPLGSVFYFWNNVFYEFRGTDVCNEAAIFTGNSFGGTIYAYNNTAFNCENSFRRNAGTFVVKNCIGNGANANDNFVGTFGAGSNYNISNRANDAPGANSKNLTVVAFVDSTNKNFHVKVTDTAAKDAGTDLSADANLPFSDDVDNEARSGTWDIGADEYVEVIEEPSIQPKLWRRRFNR